MFETLFSKKSNKNLLHLNPHINVINYDNDLICKTMKKPQTSKSDRQIKTKNFLIIDEKRNTEKDHFYIEKKSIPYSARVITSSSIRFSPENRNILSARNHFNDNESRIEEILKIKPLSQNAFSSRYNSIFGENVVPKKQPRDLKQYMNSTIENNRAKSSIGIRLSLPKEIENKMKILSVKIRQQDLFSNTKNNLKRNYFKQQNAQSPDIDYKYEISRDLLINNDLTNKVMPQKELLLHPINLTPNNIIKIDQWRVPQNKFRNIFERRSINKFHQITSNRKNNGRFSTELLDEHHPYETSKLNRQHSEKSLKSTMTNFLDDKICDVICSNTNRKVAHQRIISDYDINHNYNGFNRQNNSKVQSRRFTLKDIFNPSQASLTTNEQLPTKNIILSGRKFDQKERQIHLKENQDQNSGLFITSGTVECNPDISLHLNSDRSKVREKISEQTLKLKINETITKFFIKKPNFPNARITKSSSRKMKDDRLKSNKRIMVENRDKVKLKNMSRNLNPYLSSLPKALRENNFLDSRPILS